MAKIMEGNREGRIFIFLFLILLLVSACGDTNPQSPFNPDTGSHPGAWSNPQAIGQNDFHSGLVKAVQSTSQGAILFSTRCALCHGEGGTGKIGPTILAVADLGTINVAINLVPLMKGQADLSPAERQAIADYIATLRGGAQPVSTVLQTESCTDCHGRVLDGGIAGISCFSCHDGLDDRLDGTPVHKTAWLFSPNDPVNFHAKYGASYSASCTTCHGVDFGGGIGPACTLCHNGFVAPVLGFIPAAVQPGGQLSTITTILSGAEEVPAVNTPGTGAATLTVDLNTGAISGSVTFSGLTSNATAAHIHQAASGVNGPVIVPLAGGAGATAGAWTIPAGTVLTAVQLAALRADGLYFNIHTATNPDGEIRGQIIGSGQVTLTVVLGGAQEVPPVDTPGTGTATLTVDINTGAISGSVTFSGLISNATAAHIHQAAAGVNGPVIIPLTGGAGVTAGTWTVPPGTTLTTVQMAALRANGLYVNIHTAPNPGGEIRGQILFSGRAVLSSSAILTGAQEVPAVVTTGTGAATFTVDLTTGAISGSIDVSSLTSNGTAAHIHLGDAGVNGPVIIPLSGLSGGLGATAGIWTIPEGSVLTSDQIAALKADGLYFNVHTVNNPDGEIRGQITFSSTLTLNVALSGAQEVPAVNTPASGTAVLTVDLDTGAISGSITFTGLTSTATASHIHQGAAGVNGPVIIPLTGGLGQTAGAWTIPAGTVLTPDQLTALRANNLYLNIHTATNPGGEIRGQLIL